MRYRTAKNMERVIQLIMEKGFDRDTAVSVAPKFFAMVKPGTPSVEYFIGLLVPKSESVRSIYHDKNI